MTSNDWSSSDTMPATVSATDLFGGELFGDELMDMYNSDAVVGANSGKYDGDSERYCFQVPGSNLENSSTKTDIPHLLPSGHQDLSGNHPGAQMALDAAAMDDGLGAFRPSTSFNDLTSLLPPSTDENDAADAMMTAEAAPTIKKEMASGIKRSSPSDKTSEPAYKKKATGKPRVANNVAARRPVVKAPVANPAISNSSAGQTALKLRNQQTSFQGGRTINNTPNPLSGVMSAPVAPMRAVKPMAAPASVASPAVVSPRDAPLKADSITSDAAAAAAAVAAAVSVPVPPPAPISSPTSEADFKSVAQAAVTNLILNAGASKSEGVTAKVTDSTKVDTSTAHIKALTSTNWVAACSGGSAAASAAAAAAAADSKANRARRQNLTPDERARQNRDRNREHARNTRLRKKAYVEELKRTLTELVSQRDAAELEKRHSAQRELEQREVRFRVMEEFLKLRGRNERSFARWAAILEDNFSFVLPVTDYRKMVEKDDGNLHGLMPEAKTEQVLRGANEAMGDAGHLASFLQTLGNGTEGSQQRAPVTAMFQCERNSFFMDGCNGVIVWTTTTVGAIGEVSKDDITISTISPNNSLTFFNSQGAPMELTLKGNMRAKFSPASNKLISAEISFDTGNVAAQLQLLDAPKGELTESDLDQFDMQAEEAAAQAAAHEADALLDSLQMPQLGTAMPTAITVVSSSSERSSANAVSDKDDSSDDGCHEDSGASMGIEAGTPNMRRSARRKE
jgi:hypothetical protein